MHFSGSVKNYRSYSADIDNCLNICNYSLVAFLDWTPYLCRNSYLQMTKSEKLLSRFLSRPKDFTYIELLRLLSNFGYNEEQGSGSRVIFNNEEIKQNIKLHKPHPGNILKRYQIDLIIKELKSNELL